MTTETLTQDQANMTDSEKTRAALERAYNAPDAAPAVVDIQKLEAQKAKAEKAAKEAFIDTALDILGGGLALIGTFDPTGIADGLNTIVYGGRGIGELAKGNNSKAGWMFFNSGCSLIAVIPYIGDALGKTAMGAGAAVKLTSATTKVGAGLGKAAEIGSQIPGVTKHAQTLGKLGGMTQTAASALQAGEKVKIISTTDRLLQSGQHLAGAVLNYGNAMGNHMQKDLAARAIAEARGEPVPDKNLHKSPAANQAHRHAMTGLAAGAGLLYAGAELTDKLPPEFKDTFQNGLKELTQPGPKDLARIAGSFGNCAKQIFDTGMQWGINPVKHVNDVMANLGSKLNQMGMTPDAWNAVYGPLNQHMASAAADAKQKNAPAPDAKAKAGGPILTKPFNAIMGDG